MKTFDLIPAGDDSTRFPVKPLIQHIVERRRLARSLIFAMDDKHISEVAQTMCRIEMTRSENPFWQGLSGGMPAPWALAVGRRSSAK